MPGARHRAHRLAGLAGSRGSAAARARPAGRCRRAAGSRRSARDRELVGAGRAAEAEVDAAGIERLERAELLGDHERRVVRQHDPARADADRRRAGGDVRDHDRGRGAGDAGHVVVLGEPEAPVAEPLGVLGQVERVRGARRRASRLRRSARGRARRAAASRRISCARGGERLEAGALVRCDVASEELERAPRLLCGIFRPSECGVVLGQLLVEVRSGRAGAERPGDRLLCSSRGVGGTSERAQGDGDGVACDLDRRARRTGVSARTARACSNTGSASAYAPSSWSLQPRLLRSGPRQ